MFYQDGNSFNKFIGLIGAHYVLWGELVNLNINLLVYKKLHRVPLKRQLQCNTLIHSNI